MAREERMGAGPGQRAGQAEPSTSSMEWLCTQEAPPTTATTTRTRERAACLGLAPAGVVVAVVAVVAVVVAVVAVTNGTYSTTVPSAL